jgi:hypothetical protein
MSDKPTAWREGDDGWAFERSLRPVRYAPGERQAWAHVGDDGFGGKALQLTTSMPDVEQAKALGDALLDAVARFGIPVVEPGRERPTRRRDAEGAVMNEYIDTGRVEVYEPTAEDKKRNARRAWLAGIQESIAPLVFEAMTYGVEHSPGEDEQQLRARVDAAKALANEPMGAGIPKGKPAQPQAAREAWHKWSAKRLAAGSHKEAFHAGWDAALGPLVLALELVERDLGIEAVGDLAARVAGVGRVARAMIEERGQLYAECMQLRNGKAGATVKP